MEFRNELQKVIQEFNSVDLISSNIAYREWLERKRYTPHPTESLITSGRTSPCHSMADKKHLKDLKSLKSQDIRELIKKAQKSQKAFEEWTRQKEEKEYQEWERMQKQLLKKAKLDKIKHDKEVEKKRIQQEKITEWKHEKERASKELQQLQFKKDEDKRLDMESRRKKNEEAFKIWLKQSKKKLETHSYPHPKPWIQESEATHTTTSNNDSSNKESLLSPPHLYKERQFYTTTVPLFVKKYGIFVANGI